jgi:hypothetical protein
MKEVQKVLQRMTPRQISLVPPMAGRGANLLPAALTAGINVR